MGTMATMHDADRQSDDLEWGAFSHDAPWTLDRAGIRWLPGIDELRAAARAEVPELTRSRRLPPGLRVGAVVVRLVGALGPWLWRRHRDAYAGPEDARTDVSRTQSTQPGHPVKFADSSF